jgi:hypothetical protein
MPSRPRFRWPEDVKQKAFAFFLMGKTAAHMFDEMRVSVRDAEGNSHDLTRNIIESWIGVWHRSYATQPTPIFPGWRSSVEITPADLRAWNYAWHESTTLGGSHLQPPYNILTMEPNPRSRRAVPRTPQEERGARPSNALSHRDAEACEVLGLPTDRKPTHEEVKAQLKGLYLQFHPDKPGGTLSAEEKRAIGFFLAATRPVSASSRKSGHAHKTTHAAMVATMPICGRVSTPADIDSRATSRVDASVQYGPLVFFL